MINNVIDSTITKVLVSRDEAANGRAVYEIADGTVITSKKKLKPGKSTTKFSELENRDGALIAADDVTGAVTTNSGFQVIAEQDDGFVRSNYEFEGKGGGGSAIPKGRPKQISNIKKFERKNDLDINEDGLFAGKDPITGKPPKPDAMPGGDQPGGEQPAGGDGPRGGSRGDDKPGGSKDGDKSGGGRGDDKPGGSNGDDTGVPLTPTPAPDPLPGPSPVAGPLPGPSPAPGPDSSPLPLPGPNPAPKPAPAPVPSPGPGPSPSPDTTPSPGPEPSPTPGPAPAPVPSPGPGPSPSPDPTPSPGPEPSPAPGPAPSPSPGRGGGPRRRMIEVDPQQIDRSWDFEQQQSAADEIKSFDRLFQSNDLFSSHSDLI